MRTVAPPAADPLEEVLGASEAAAAMRAFGRRAAAVPAPVLLTGETGTGKGVLARAIHAASPRSRAAFVAVNCAGVPEALFESEFFGHTRGAFTGAHHAHRGVLEQADRGTLFLDEIGELPPTLQAKLLTVLEDGEVRRLGGERVVRVDVRLIAATAQDLEAAVGDGRFRLDLYHRLLVLGFTIPPLRARGDDALLLAQHFLTRQCARYARPTLALSAGAERRIRAHAWPGNVRQLANAIEAAVLATEGPLIRARDLPLPAAVQPAAPSPVGQVPGRPQPASAHAAVAGEPDTIGGVLAAPAEVRRARYSFFGSPDEERTMILRVLRRCHGNKTRTAATLGMTRNTLRARLRTLGIAAGGAADDGTADDGATAIAEARPPP